MIRLFGHRLKGDELAMLLLDKPYISNLLQETAVALELPVLKKESLEGMLWNKNINLLSETSFIDMLEKKSPHKLYSNSENAINWMMKNLEGTRIPEFIDTCKDKVKFREKIKPLYPDFYYQEINNEILFQLDVTKIKKPFIIKPSVGFFSIGVYKVEKDEDWPEIIANLITDIQNAKGLYPEEVMDASCFIIEECVVGEEFAIDAYYDHTGEPVILNILKHPFSSSTDVSDRIYYTSVDLISQYLVPFQQVLKDIGACTGLVDFPVHAEVRVDENGHVVPIELNPMRFAGWCVTDLAFFAYDLNPYIYYFKGQKPDWEKIIKEKEGKRYCMILVDMPHGMLAEDVLGFQYDALSSKFQKVMEVRKIDYHKYPVFGFYFIETPANSDEIDMVLSLDFNEFVIR